MVVGHLAVGYLISQLPTIFGVPLSPFHQFLVIGAAYFNDFDLAFAHKFVKSPNNHHALPTHTPFASLLFILILWLLFFRLVPTQVFVWMYLSMLSHLILDDSSHWFQKLKLQPETKDPQIAWFWPFIKHSADPSTFKHMSLSQGLKIYYATTPFSTAVEVALIIFAVLFFVYTLYR